MAIGAPHDGDQVAPVFDLCGVGGGGQGRCRGDQDGETAKRGEHGRDP
jgi:hypothetical protein